MDKVKVGIVGSRFAAGLHAEAYKRCPNAEVSAVAAIDNLEEFKKKHNIPKAYADYREMLKKADIDLVSVCVPNFLHKEVVLAAADAGKQIICEKPLATTLDDAKLMVEHCAKKKVKLMYGEDWLFAPALKRIKSICDEGGIGDVLYIKAKEVHPGSHSLYAQKKAYCGGGAIIHLAIHPIGFVRWFRQKEVVEVIGKVSGGGIENYKHAHFEGEDWGAAILLFEDNRPAFIEGNYITAGGLDDIVEVYGTKGTMRVDLTKGSPISMFSIPGYGYSIEKAELTTGWSNPAVDEEAALGYVDEISYFVDCVRLNSEVAFGSRGEDGLKAMEIVTAIYKSSTEGRPVKI
jgi:predicted dehydrogenase